MIGFPRQQLLHWYRRNARDLPWRRTRNPYRIWLSEMMLQQTQVATVIPYYEKFLQRFPDVRTLALAPLTQVLDAWSGLGYYTRAKNMHRAAQQVTQLHGEKFPSDPQLLQALPGIGRYTAGAVASIAFNKPAPILDGNVIRVLCRYFGIRQDPRPPKTNQRLWKLAEEVLDHQSPGDFNQAMMELGATVCLPKTPDCLSCPLQSSCSAFKLNLQNKIPKTAAAVPRKKIHYVCGVLQEKGNYCLVRRPLTGLLPGLWEFPGGERVDNQKSAPGCVRQLLLERLGIEVEVGQVLGSIRQILTHRELNITAFSCRRLKGQLQMKNYYLEMRRVPASKLTQMPLTAGMNRIGRLILEKN